MADIPSQITDRNLEATTVISLKREPACFAFLSARALMPPLPMDAINLDLASVDYFAGRASLWVTLEVRSAATDDQPTAILGFDETFLRPFTRALIEAATTRTAFRMTMSRGGEFRSPEPRGTEPRGGSRSARHHVVEYVTGAGTALGALVLTPYEQVVLVAAGGDQEESLFQLPRSDSFLRSFARMTHQADGALRDTLADSERLARHRLVG